MEPVAGAGVICGVIPFEHTQRVRIRAELATLNGVLRAPFQDPITATIHAWHGRFLEAVQAAGDALDPVIDAYASELQGILVDPIEGFPLEEECYLGNDMCTYGKCALAYYIDRLPEVLKGRSPCRIDNHVPFFAVRHTVVEGALAWLKKYRPLQPLSPDVRVRYEQMESEGILPQVPDNPRRAGLLERARRIRLEERAAQEAIERDAERLREAILARAEAGIDAVFAPLEAAAREVGGDMEQAAQEAMEREDEVEAHLEREQAHWEALARDFEQRNLDLDQRLDRLEADLPEIAQRTAVLERNIEETKRAQEANKKNPFGEIFLVVAIGVASYYVPHLTMSKTAGGGTIGGVWAI